LYVNWKLLIIVYISQFNRYTVWRWRFLSVTIAALFKRILHPLGSKDECTLCTLIILFIIIYFSNLVLKFRFLLLLTNHDRRYFFSFSSHSISSGRSEENSLLHGETTPSSPVHASRIILYFFLSRCCWNPTTVVTIYKKQWRMNSRDKTYLPRRWRTEVARVEYRPLKGHAFMDPLLGRITYPEPLGNERLPPMRMLYIAYSNYALKDYDSRRLARFAW